MARNLGEIRREEIVEAVLAVLVENGPGALSTRLVAEKVGMSKSSLYQHFDSLDDMLRAAAENLQQRMTETVRTATAYSESPREQFRRIAHQTPRLASLFSVFHMLETYLPLSRKEWFIELRVHKTEMERHMQDISQKMIDQGQARSDLTAEEIVCIGTGLFREFIITWQFVNPTPQEDMEREVERMWSLFMKVIAPIGKTGSDTAGSRD